MNKKLIEYLIIAILIILLLYACFSFIGYKYVNKHKNITDSVEMYYPASSDVIVEGDTIKFRNSYYGFYNLDVCKLNSSDQKIVNLLNHFSKVNQGTKDYKNESAYLLTMEYPEENGYMYHSMIIPLDSFDEESLSFTNKTEVYLFEGNNREFVVDSAFNSQVVI